MKKTLLTTILILLASPALAKDHTIREISDPAGDRPYYFLPDSLTIQPGDTVTFLNAQEDMHDVMFVDVPKGVDEMIMSPMHKKEGDKWSYTFTVPGTYKFHCHPHEALGMKGVLIVGQASKHGETHAMDHHKMAAKAEAAPAADTHRGTGKINGVDAAQHTVNVTHDPIKSLGWPKMKMEFAVDKAVDLSAFKAGDAVSFTLKAQGDEDYSVTHIEKTQ